MKRNLKSRVLARRAATLPSVICFAMMAAVAAGFVWACSQERTTGSESVNLPPDTRIHTPWHLVNVHLYATNEPNDIQSYCTTFSITGNVPDDINVYISPFNQRINRIRFYGGIQTRIDGYSDRDQARTSFVSRNRGAIFSRWEERNPDAIRQAPGGLFRSAGYEGDFISVRNDFRWKNGSYRLCLVKSDVVEGAPLPANYTADDVAYSWGRYVHTWVRMEATDLSTDETTIIGALAFPGRTLSLRAINTIFVEIYGHGGTISIGDVPVFTVSFSNFRVDGENLRFNRIVEITNPFAVHTAAPVVAHTRYLDDDVIQIQIGRLIGKTGRIVREIAAN